MKKKLLIGFAIILLFLDWAALHDILGGKEPVAALGGEYLMIIGSIPILIIIRYLLYWKKNK